MTTANTPTMTLHECAEVFRANLIRVSEEKLGQGIVEGKFPFAVGIGGRHVSYMIFRRSLYKWLEAQIGEVVRLEGDDL